MLNIYFFIFKMINSKFIKYFQKIYLEKIIEKIIKKSFKKR